MNATERGRCWEASSRVLATNLPINEAAVSKGSCGSPVPGEEESAASRRDRKFRGDRVSFLASHEAANSRARVHAYLGHNVRSRSRRSLAVFCAGYVHVPRSARVTRSRGFLDARERCTERIAGDAHSLVRFRDLAANVRLIELLATNEQRSDSSRPAANVRRHCGTSVGRGGARKLLERYARATRVLVHPGAS